VFVTTSITEGWDGYFKGKLMNMGVYTVILRVQIGGKEDKIMQKIKLLK